MMKKLLLLSLALLAVLSCSRPKLVILHVNDTHSHMEPVRTGEEAGLGGVIERAAFIDSVRNAEGESRVLLLHAGDFSQGSSYFTLLGGEMEIDLMNAMRYDCVTLGNHEFDNGIEAMAPRLSRLQCPIVCANLDFSQFPLGDIVKPYAVIERGGMKIGIIGLTTNLKKSVMNNIADRIPVLDNVEVVNKYAAELSWCDLVILLTHIGYKNDCELIPQTHGVDLLVGGHSHTRLDGPTYVKDADGKDVMIVTGWYWGLEMGKVTVR